MWWLVAILLVFLGVSIFIIVNLIRKYERLEDSYESISDKSSQILTQIHDVITYITNQLKVIDERGSFEADDEIGFFFKEVKRLSELLSEFLPEEEEQL